MNIEAVVIKKMPLREHDQLVTLYSRETGKCSVVAKGSLRAHSKQALSLDEGNLIHGELIQGRGGLILTGAQAVRTYVSAKESIKKWAAVQFFLQAFDVMVFDEQSDEHLWDCLCDTLAGFEQANGNILDVFRQRQRTLLMALGYGVCPEALLDQTFEQIAQRRFSSLPLLYGVADGVFS